MYNIIVRAIVLLIGIFLYIKIDEKYRVANKINSKLNINKEWKSYMLSVIILISGLIISTGIRIIEHMPNMVTKIVTALIFGIALCLSERIVSEFKLADK
ncbi:hypothetical protein [Clostridium uliginosum]|uniref:Uncharacterized protein n=1 Tax=Clostridium uliginosum TaxID=119641 RepID=A0A1I1IQ78_9CLOT|nr:hypothetical protein [Clostridium uliginosum]SFC38386.1 hypothetical protein SAMN05421842_10339 [Clostridium uliginosum]